MEDKLMQIINHFGIETQQRKLMEETFELQNAITIHETAKSNEWEIPLNYIVGTKEHITEELADCLVLLFQFKEYYKIDGYSILRELNKKIDRTIERIESGYYE